MTSDGKTMLSWKNEYFHLRKWIRDNIPEKACLKRHHCLHVGKPDCQDCNLYIFDRDPTKGYKNEQ